MFRDNPVPVLGKWIGEKYCCGLDIGAQTIKAGLIKLREHQPAELLGVYETKTSGYRDGSVSDLGELSECIHATVAGIIKKTGVKLKDIELGLGAELIEARYASAVIPLMDRGSKIITERDVRRIQAQARALGVNMDEVLVHEFPQYYRIDDVNIALNPIGLYGRKLEIQSLLMVVKETLVKNLTKAVNQAGFDVANLFFTSYSSSMAALDPDRKKKGCAFVDVGSSVTNVLIFHEGRLKHLTKIAVGADKFTASIAAALNLTSELAEDIKKSYAVAGGQDDSFKEEILIKREEGYAPIKKEDIMQAIEPVAAHLVREIQSALAASDLMDQMNAGMVMAGGGALLPGLPERIEAATGLAVAIGKVRLAVRKLNNAAKYASAVGLAQSGVDKAYGYDATGKKDGSLPVRLAHKIRELYQEYF